MTYPETIRYLESFINYEKIPAYPYKQSFKLERIKDFLNALDNPQDTLRCLHVAGTKGKGSTCAFVTYILRQAGYRVGLYTSPHLSDFRERIRILKPNLARNRAHPEEDFEGMITRNELSGLASRVKPLIDDYNKNSKYGPLSFFEVYTTLAFLYFEQKKVDFVVLETGLGGRLDATNTVNALVCAITPISYEHTQKLGNTLREIAGEKAGIIKEQRQPVVISAPQEKEAARVIIGRCKAVGARLFEVGRDITFRKRKGSFSLKGILRRYPDLKVNLPGEHQLVNASLAVGVTEALSFYGVNISKDSVSRGLNNTVWPGRCEVISRNPQVVLDGAQNIASSKALKRTIREGFKYKNLILVLGISKDKDIRGICNQLRGLASVVILTEANNPRAALASGLAKYFPSKKAYLTSSVSQAKKLASRIAGRNDLILVCGSLFVVGEYRDEKL